MSTAPTTHGKRELESAIMDAQGDMLLLGLAIEAVMERVDEHRPKGGVPDGESFPVAVDENHVTALSHARNRLHDSLKALSATFYGAWS